MAIYVAIGYECPHNMRATRRLTRRWKRFPRVVALKRYIWNRAAHRFRASVMRLVEQLPVFAPNSAGSLRSRAQVTIDDANLTFPVLVELLSVVGRTSVSQPRPILSLPDTPTRRASAARLKKLFERHGSDKAVHLYDHLYGALSKTSPCAREQCA